MKPMAKNALLVLSGGIGSIVSLMIAFAIFGTDTQQPSQENRPETLGNPPPETPAQAANPTPEKKKVTKKIDKTQYFALNPSTENKQIYEEAKEYLISCWNDDKNKECIDNHDRFIREYINAYSGDWLAQSNVGAMLRTGSDYSLTQNNTQACAWKIVSMRSGSPYIRDVDTFSLNDTCDLAGGVHNTTSQARARQIEAYIRSHKIKPIPVPQIDYDPTRDKDEQNAGD